MRHRAQRSPSMSNPKKRRSPPSTISASSAGTIPLTKKHNKNTSGSRKNKSQSSLRSQMCTVFQMTKTRSYKSRSHALMSISTIMRLDPTSRLRHGHPYQVSPTNLSPPARTKSPSRPPSKSATSHSSNSKNQRVTPSGREAR